MELSGYIKRFVPLFGEWKAEKFIGEGSYGKVWQAVNNNGMKKAIKEVIVPAESAGTIEMACLQGLDIENAKKYFAETLNETIAEAEMQKSLSDCRNIVHFLDYTVKELNNTDEFGWVVFILMDKVQVFTEYIMEHGIEISSFINLGIDLCNALCRCRESEIIHRDIKPENIFYDSEYNCFQLGDFGIAHYLSRPTANKGRAGTLTHMSPQVYQGADFCFKDDLYAVSMILYKIMNFNRVPLLPDYPEPYMPNQRDNALIKRLKGGELPLPAITRIPYEKIFEVNSIRAGMRINDSYDYELMQKLAEIVHKAIAPDENNRYADALELKNVLSELLY